MSTLKREIERHVLPGSLIFTDRHKSYSFLGRAGSQYVHRAVNHKAGEFSRVERVFGEDINVTTNAVEGLFGRLKTYLRQRQYGRVGKKAYGELLAEFLWHQRCSAFGVEPFYNLMREIKTWQDAHPRRVQVLCSQFAVFFIHSRKRNSPVFRAQYYKSFSSCQVERPFTAEDIPSDIRSDFESLLPDENEEDEPVPQDVPAHAQQMPRNEPIRPPRLPTPPEFRDDSPVPESVPRQLQHSSGSEGPCLPQGLKREPDTDTDSSSVEVLCIKPASKKARRASATIKKEPAQGSEVPAPLPVAREKRGPFCAQGHDMTWVAPPDSVVLSARKYAYFHVTCNVCEAAVTGSTYRCDACDWDVCLTCAEQA